MRINAYPKDPDGSSIKIHVQPQANSTIGCTRGVFGRQKARMDTDLPEISKRYIFIAAIALIFGFVFAIIGFFRGPLENDGSLPHPPGMARHEWHEGDGAERRFVRADYHGGGWTVSTRLRDEEEWTPYDPIDEEMWRKLRDVLWRKYQRKRCPWKLIEAIDKILGDDGAAGN